MITYHDVETGLGKHEAEKAADRYRAVGIEAEVVTRLDIYNCRSYAVKTCIRSGKDEK